MSSSLKPESSRASKHLSQATSPVSSHSRVAPEMSTREHSRSHRGDEPSKSSRHSSVNKGVDRYETDHPPSVTKVYQETEIQRPWVMPVVSTKAPENYASRVKSARNPTGHVSKHDASGLTWKHESKRTSTGTQIQVPVSALTAHSSHSTRRDSSSRRDSLVSDGPNGRHGNSGRASSKYDDATDLTSDLNSRYDGYSGSSAYRGMSSRFGDYSDASTYHGSSSRYDDDSTRRPAPNSTALTYRSSWREDNTTLARATSTRLSDIPESSSDTTTKTMLKDSSKSGRGLSVKVPKGANVVVNIFHAPVINQSGSDSRRK